VAGTPHNLVRNFKDLPPPPESGKDIHLFLLLLELAKTAPTYPSASDYGPSSLLPTTKS